MLNFGTVLKNQYFQTLVTIHVGNFSGKKEWASLYTQRFNIAWQSTTKFHRFWRAVMTNSFRSMFIILAKFLSLKGEKVGSEFLQICASLQYVLHNYKVSRNSVFKAISEELCRQKKYTGLTDGLTDRRIDWLNDSLKTLYPL